MPINEFSDLSTAQWAEDAKHIVIKRVFDPRSQICLCCLATSYGRCQVKMTIGVGQTAQADLAPGWVIVVTLRECPWEVVPRSLLLPGSLLIPSIRPPSSFALSTSMWFT